MDDAFYPAALHPTLGILAATLRRGSLAVVPRVRQTDAGIERSLNAQVSESGVSYDQICVLLCYGA